MDRVGRSYPSIPGQHELRIAFDLILLLDKHLFRVPVIGVGLDLDMT